MLENCPLSAVHYCLSNSYIRSHPLYMEAAFFKCNLRTGQVVVTEKLLGFFKILVTICSDIAKKNHNPNEEGLLLIASHKRK